MAEFRRLIFNRRGQGQVSLEVAMVLIASTILISAIAKSWFWINNNLAGRLDHYKTSRLQAGADTPGEKWGYQQTNLNLF